MGLFDKLKTNPAPTNSVQTSTNKSVKITINGGICPWLFKVVALLLQEYLLLLEYESLLL